MKISKILEFLSEQKIKYSFKGDRNTEIIGFSSLNNYKKNTFTWIKNNKVHVPEGINIGLLFTDDTVVYEADNNIITNQSKYAFFITIEKLFIKEEARKHIGENTYISKDVVLANTATVGHNCSIDGNIKIGGGTSIGNNVSIVGNVVIGENCDIQSNISIGHSGLGYNKLEDGKLSMIKHFGGVTIENNCFIGSNTEIARGTIDDTVVGAGSKIDMQCHIAHNSQIGKNVTIIANTTLYGSVKIEDNAYIATAIIKNQSKIGKDAFVGMGSVIIKDVPDNCSVMGAAVKELMRSSRNN